MPPARRDWFFDGSGVLGIPSIAYPFYVAWFAIACTIGVIIGNILLSAFYFTVVTGLRFMLQLFGKCPILKRPTRSNSTYWRDVEKIKDVREYFRQF